MLPQKNSSPVSSSGLCAGVEQIQGAFTGEGEVMDQSEEDSVVLNHHRKEVEQQPSDQSVVHAGSPDQMEVREQPTRGQEGDSGEELDTDLETDGTLR